MSPPKRKRIKKAMTEDAAADEGDVVPATGQESMGSKREREAAGAEDPESQGEEGDEHGRTDEDEGQEGQEEVASQGPRMRPSRTYSSSLMLVNIELSCLAKGRDHLDEDEARLAEGLGKPIFHNFVDLTTIICLQVL